MKIRISLKTLRVLVAVGFGLLLGVARGQAHYINAGDVQGFVWMLNSDGESVSIYGYDGAGGAVTVPATVPVQLNNAEATNLPVISIGDWAFSNCTNLTSIVLPDSIANLDGYVFYGCVALTNVAVGKGVTSIGAGDFAGCTSLINVSLPDGVTNIQADAFDGCAELAQVTLGTNVASLGNLAFAGCTHLLSVNIPNQVGNVGDYAFAGCLALTNVNIGTKVANIGISAFAECSSLSRVIIPNSVGSIGAGAFADCAHLTNVMIGAGVTNIGISAFGGCGVPGLYPGPILSVPLPIIPTPILPITPVLITNVVTINPITINPITNVLFTNVVTINPITISPITNLLFTNVLQLNPVTNATVTLTASVSAHSVASSATAAVVAEPCSSLLSITVAAANSAFSSLNGVLFDKLQTTLLQFPGGQGGRYTIPNSVKMIGPDAFLSAERLTSIVMPNNLTDVGANAFIGCSALTNFTVLVGSRALSSVDGVLYDKQHNFLLQYPTGRSGPYTVPLWVSEIASRAFAGCTRLTRVAIMEKVSTIGSQAFDGCISLTNVILPNRLDSINDGLFENCTHLSSIAIPGGVTTIGDNAFTGCGALTALGLPDSIQSIGSFAFAACSSLVDVVLPDQLANISQDAFANCTHLAGITIPDSVTNIAAFAFIGCSRLTQVRLPNRLVNVGDGAFVNCISLTSLIIPNSVTNLGVQVFDGCSNLSEVFIQGNAPGTNGTSGAFGDGVFAGDTNTTVYYLAGTTGWASDFGGAPAVQANPTLTVLVNGQGTVTPDDNGVLLQLGASYQLTATPRPGYKFLNWTGGTHSPLLVLTNGPHLKFPMQLNLVLQANFTSPALKLRMLAATRVPAAVAGPVFSLRSEANVSGHIEYSTDMVHWTRLTQFQTTNSEVTFRDPTATNAVQRFYRAVTP
jgi:hypothetical protein